MVKRELSGNALLTEDGPRTKKRKDEAEESYAANDAEVQEGAINSDQEQGESGETVAEGPAMSLEEVRDEGLAVMTVLKEATNKEGRLISHDFWRLPSKRQFPDYYEIIKRPIALDDIKANLENFAYTSLEVFREELETCFKNAKKYNMRESVIWKDAKSLQKIAMKEVDRIRRKYSDEDENEGSDKESGKKKEKGVNVHRLMKNRLQKLITKTNDNGELISTPFMELPPKKKWPMYYKIIKRPICIEDVFKRIKRKEYITIPDFMADVDLVFSNAMTFNEDGSHIWNHAHTLKDYFHQIMSDLPSKYNLNGTVEGASEATHSKIKLKIPGHQGTHADTSASSGQNADTNAGTTRLRVPTHGAEAAAVIAPQPVAPTEAPPPLTNGVEATPVNGTSKAKSPVAATTQLPDVSTLPLPAPTPKRAKAIPAHLKSSLSDQQQTPMHPSPPVVTPSASIYQYTTSTQIPSSTFYPQTPLTSNVTVPTATPSRTSATPVPHASSSSTIGERASPKPSIRSAGVHSVRLEVLPTGRRLPLLDIGTGVRNWAVRLSSEENGLIVKDVRFERIGDGEGEGSDEEHEKDKAEVALPPKKRGRGRPRKNPAVEKPSEAPIKSPTDAGLNSKMTLKKSNIIFPAAENVLVRLDGVVVASQPHTKDESEIMEKKSNVDVDGSSEKLKPTEEWTIGLTSGQHILEVGRNGNDVLWQIYVYV